MALSLDRTDRKLLNLLQGSFPLVSRPFAVLGVELGVTEDNAIDSGAAQRKLNAWRAFVPLASLAVLDTPPTRT